MRAFYDEKPSVIESVGNGSFLYRYAIEEVETSAPEQSDDTERPVRSQFQCQEVTVFAPLTSNKITEAVIADRWDPTYEQKLVNEYNAANLGLIGGSKTSDEAKERIANYKAFLTDRSEVKAQIDADCVALGIK